LDLRVLSYGRHSARHAPHGPEPPGVVGRRAEAAAKEGIPVDEGKTTSIWVGRMQAVGSAQARYLWFLLVLGIFYWALHAEVSDAASDPGNTLSVPIVDLEISAPAVWASGPGVLSFVVLAVFGALRAYGRAERKLQLDTDLALSGSTEPFDLHPNAIDLAVYTSEKSPKWVAALLYFSYPLALTVFVAEAGWLLTDLALSSRYIPSKWAFVLIGALLWVPAVIQLGIFWWKRLKRAVRGPSVRKT